MNLHETDSYESSPNYNTERKWKARNFSWFCLCLLSLILSKILFWCILLLKMDSHGTFFVLLPSLPCSFLKLYSGHFLWVDKFKFTSFFNQPCMDIAFPWWTFIWKFFFFTFVSLFCSIIISVLAFFVHLAALSWRSCGSSVWGAWLFLRMLTAGPLYLTEGPYAHLLVDWAQSLPASGAFLTLAGHTFQWTLVDSLGILSSDPAHAPSASSCTDSGFTQFWWQYNFRSLETTT